MRPQAPRGEVQAPRSSSPGGAAVVVVAFGASDEGNAPAPLPSSEAAVAAFPPAEGKGAVESQQSTGEIAKIDCGDNGSGQAQQQIAGEEGNSVAPITCGIASMPFCPPTSRDPAPAEVAAETPPPPPANIVKFWPERLPAEEEVSCPTPCFWVERALFFRSFFQLKRKRERDRASKNQEKLERESKNQEKLDFSLFSPLFSLCSLSLFSFLKKT